MASIIGKVHAAVIAGGIGLAGATSLIIGHDLDKTAACEKEKQKTVASTDPTVAIPCTLPPLTPR